MHDGGGHISSSDTSSSFTSHTSHTSHSPSGTSNPNDMIYYASNGTNFNAGTNYDPSAVFYNTGASYSAGASVRRGGSAAGMIILLAILAAVLLPFLIVLIELRVI